MEDVTTCGAPSASFTFAGCAEDSAINAWRTSVTGPQKSYLSKAPKPDDNAHINSIVAKLNKYRSYRQAENRLEKIERALRSLKNYAENDRVVFFKFERPIRQVLVWIYAALLHGKLATEPVCIQSQQLELIAHSLDVRSRIKGSHEGPFSQEQVAKAIGLGSASKKTLSKRKKQAMAQRKQQLNPGNQDFPGVFADQNLQELCTMDQKSFCAATNKAIKEAIQLLWKEPKKPKRRQNRKKPSFPAERPLNKKMERARDPWKNGMRVSEEATAIRSDDRNAPPWKGKFRAKSLRETALTAAET